MYSTMSSSSSSRKQTSNILKHFLLLAYCLCSSGESITFRLPLLSGCWWFFFLEATAASTGTKYLQHTALLFCDKNLNSISRESYMSMAGGLCYMGLLIGVYCITFIERNCLGVRLRENALFALSGRGAI